MTMKLQNALWLVALLALAGDVACAEMKTEYWDNNQQGFNKLAQRIEEMNGRNLLGRTGVKISGDNSKAVELADGSAGVAGGEGRVAIDGQPSVIAFYLGQAKPIHEVGVFTFNCDARANQDFEVRLADNSAHPSQKPTFPEAASLATGDKILGKDGGGFHTWFISPGGGPLIPGKADWIEFRIWRTYNAKAGSPAKTKDPGGWTAVVELEALGEPNDVIVIPPEEKARIAALKELSQRPPYEKKTTWQESMLASREALLRWEGEIQRLGAELKQPITKSGGDLKQQQIARRMQLYDKLKGDFKDPVGLAQIKWEQSDSVWVRFERRDMAGREYFLTDWAPGKPDVIVKQYNAFAEIRAAAVDKELATIEPAIKAKVGPWLARFQAGKAPEALEEARQRYYAAATIQETMAEHHKIESMRLAVKDQQEMFGERYPKAAEYLKRLDALEELMNAAWEQILPGPGEASAALLAVREKAAAEGEEILLANPLLGFDKLLLGKGGPGFASNWGGPNHIGNELVTLSPVRPEGKITTVYKGGHISDMDLSFDAKRILFSENERIHEVNVDGTGHRQITAHTDPHTKHYDVCRLPSGQIMFVSTACEQAVPCTGEWYVGNMHLINDDGTHERRLCFDQDHDWNPCVLENGQVIYTRWEYTDTPHYFTRLLFTMNPDGSNQTALYGSNSYWPNAKYWPRQIPGKPTQLVCIASGHHGVSRVGQMLVLDVAKGRQEAGGVVHRIGDRGKRVEAVIQDALVMEWWPRFAWPYPLSEPETNRGAGKYFLANCQSDQFSPWAVCLVDVFDNITPLLTGNYAEPIPLRARPAPPVIPPRVDPQRKDALVYMANVYHGGGLRGYPPGSVKALRLGSHEYRYGGNGDTYACTFEGGWDVKQILGTVPVEPDGSAFFRVPANTPIFVQPLDADGKSLQVMRSWFSAMPGEVLSCVGCHENQNQAPPSYPLLAARKTPAEIQPWYGPARGFSFDHEVQPVLDRRCAGCHNGERRPDGKQLSDSRAKQFHPDYKGSYSPAYQALAPYVRRAGYESDYHLPAPAEFHASTSALIQLLEKGHHNVTLTTEERDRIYTWMDFNVPYAGNWRESHVPPQDDQVVRRAKYKALHANVDDHSEDPLPPAAVAVFEPPAPEAPRPAPLKLEGWPLTAAQAADLQKRTALAEMKLDLGDGLTLALVPVPAGKFVMGDATTGFPDEYPEAAVSIEQPFYISRLEVTNRQYAQFDPAHDSAYIDARGKDRYTRGYPANQPEQPVVRISWHEAMAFCRWLSEKTRCECSLPTEAQWEWACRAGSSTSWSFGASFEKLRDVANVADSTLNGWAWGRVDRGYSDGAMFSIPGGKYKPNAWGLCDMHGNVAEWTRSEYRPYPYVAGDGRNDVQTTGPKVVRGGSWNDTFSFCRSASRWRYLSCQPVYNVGFRVVCKPAKVATGP